MAWFARALTSISRMANLDRPFKSSLRGFTAHMAIIATSQIRNVQ